MSDIRKAIMERLGAVAEGEKATMSKASDALNYIKNSIASGKTVYVTAGSRTTKVTPQTYAKWEASGRPLFKLGNDGALLMASGSSYVRLTMGDDMMLAGITAMSRPGEKAAMAKWTVTPTKKHGKDIEEHTAKIGRDHWKIDTMPHLGKSVGSLYRWDEMRGLRHISTGNIEQLKRQAEAISTKQDDLSDVMRGFSRPGAKEVFAAQFQVGRVYEHAWANDSDSYGFWKVISRSGAMMVVQDVGSGGRVRTTDPQDIRYVESPRSGEQKRVKIHSDDRGEYAYPTGKYSMAPIIRATNPKSSRWSKTGSKDRFAQDAGSVAKEILRQLGGGRFMAMVGGKNAMHGMFNGKPGLQVSIGKGAEGGINRLIVTLDPATDTYDMEFWRIANRGLSTKKVSEAHGVYADDLQRVFTDRTKFYTSMSRPGAKSTNALSDACWQGYEAVGTKKQDGKTVPNCVPKATAAKPESQDIESEEVKAGLKLMEKADEKVSEKIRTLIKEGKPQDQAVAIALDMKRRGEL